MVNYDVISTCEEISFEFKRKEIDTHKIITSQRHYDKQQKPETKGQILHDVTFMRY